MEEKVTLWAARDDDGLLYAFEHCPLRSTFLYGFWEDLGRYAFELPKTLLPDLKWEDEPIEIELIIKRK